MSGYKVDLLPKTSYMEYDNFYMELLNEEKKTFALDLYFNIHNNQLLSILLLFDFQCLRIF